MESNNAPAEPSGPVAENRKPRRSRPPKSAQRVERVGDNPRREDAVKRAEEGAPPSSQARLVPSSVTRKTDRTSHKLNPAANEFKPSADSVLPTGGAQPATPADAQPENRARKPRSRPRKAPHDALVATRTVVLQGKEGGEIVAKVPRPRRNEHKAPPNQPSGTALLQEEELIELSCPICTESVSYFAVGRCNHHVCSLCAVRMRVKSKDTHCAICKENLDVMVIYHAHPATHSGSTPGQIVDESQFLRPFNSFGLTAADCDVDNGNIPGVQVDHLGGFLFVDCTKHYNEIETLRAMVCPFKQCKTRFPTIQTLQKHLKEQHKDSQLCTLCVENRPLFVSEHTVMNPKQLLCHFKGEEFVEAHGQHHRAPASENVHTKGHPQCEFCTERFFDNAALYYHMQRQYFTCHLCPRQHMFRYYIDAAALREHHHRDHIVCSICAASPQLYDSDVAIAFRDAREYSDHMRHVHNAHVSSAAGGASQNKTSFRLGASSTYQSNNPSAVRRDKHGRPRVTVVDLDMGTANPYRTESDANTSNNNRATVVSRPADAVAAMIPAHMRIAGRVTGAGRFAPLDSQDLLMQAAAEEYAKAAEKEARGQKKSLRLSQDQAFPALSASVSAPVAALPKNRVWSSKVGGSQSQFGEGEAVSGNESSSVNDTSPLPARPVTATAELHPMSLLHSSKQQAKDAQRRKDAEAAEKAHQEKLRLEDKRIERNLNLASALLGGANSTKNAAVTLTAADVGATLKNRSYVSSITSPLQGLGWSESELMRPIYPPVLVNWARLHLTELLKIEKKIYTLMTDAAMNSVQLKPMARGMRTVVHQLSRMYLLNSYEYDPEPNRYVSLVKQVDSYLPSCVLSRAAALPVNTLPGENGTEVPDLPIVYLALSSESYSAGLVNTNSSVSSAGKKAPSQGVTGAASTAEPVRIAFTVAEIVSRIKDLLESPELWRAWYQYSLEVGAPAGPAPLAVPELMMDEFGEYHEVPLPPPPPPGFGSSPAIKPRALSELPVPRIESLVSAGASTFGLRFVDRASAQIAVHFFKFCVNLHYSSNGSNTKMSSRVQHGPIALDAAQLSPKLQQQLTVLSVFTLHAAFVTCSVTDLVYAIPSSDKSSPAVTSNKPAGAEVQAATLDRRHYTSSTAEEPWMTVSKAAPKSAPIAATAPAQKGAPVTADGWQFQAVKTRRYDANDPVVNQAVPSHSMLVQDNWEDFDQLATDFNQKASAEEAPVDAERAEEWESFLTEKRVKAEQSGVARYQPKRSETAASAALTPAAMNTSPPAAKYVPPSARTRSQGDAGASAGAGADNTYGGAVGDVEEESNEEVLAEVAEVAGVAEPCLEDEEYDLCADVAEPPAATADPALVYPTDYLDSEEAFEEYLRQMQLQHEQGAPAGPTAGSSRAARPAREVTAQPYNAALTHVGLASGRGYSNAPSTAMAVVAVPIEDGESDDDGAEATREVLRRQMQREQERGHYNKFGVLDEEDADNDA